MDTRRTNNARWTAQTPRRHTAKRSHVACPFATDRAVSMLTHHFMLPMPRSVTVRSIKTCHRNILTWHVVSLVPVISKTFKLFVKSLKRIIWRAEHVNFPCSFVDKFEPVPKKGLGPDRHMQLLLFNLGKWCNTNTPVTNNRFHFHRYLDQDWYAH